MVEAVAPPPAAWVAPLSVEAKPKARVEPAVWKRSAEVPTRPVPESRSGRGKYLVVNSVEALAAWPSGHSVAIAAGNLRDADELARLLPIVEAAVEGQKDPLVLVAGIERQQGPRDSAVSRARRGLEEMGAVFVERPAQLGGLEAIADFLNREYAPDPVSLEAALAPVAKIDVAEGTDASVYLEPRPGFEGDHYFLRHDSRQRIDAGGGRRKKT